MYCPSCGKSADPGASFCGSCGSALPPEPPPPPDAGAYQPPPPPPLLSGDDSDPRLGELVPALEAAIAMLQLDRLAIRRVAATDAAQRMALVFIAVAGLCWGLGHLSFFGVVAGPVAMLAGVAIAAGIAHVVATNLGGHGSYPALFRCYGFLFVTGVVGIVPFLGTVLVVAANVWFLIVLVPTFEEVYRMPRDKAILAVAILIGIWIAISVLLFAAIFFGILSLFALAR